MPVKATEMHRGTIKGLKGQIDTLGINVQQILVPILNDFLPMNTPPFF